MPVVLRLPESLFRGLAYGHLQHLLSVSREGYLAAGCLLLQLTEVTTLWLTAALRVEAQYIFDRSKDGGMVWHEVPTCCPAKQRMHGCLATSLETFCICTSSKPSHCVSTRPDPSCATDTHETGTKNYTPRANDFIRSLLFLAS